MQTHQFIQQLWFDYLHVTPQAKTIHLAFEAAGETLVNDHLAFRTFDQSPINLVMLEQHLLNMGYQHFEPYYFSDKHLNAWCYLPPEKGLPRIFFSELITAQLSEAAQQIIYKLIQEIPVEVVKRPAVFWAGRLWSMPCWHDYQTLLQESEYAAWLSVMGLRANHFTLSVNHLTQHKDLSAVLDRVEGLGIQLNQSGGRIKGSKETLLEQGATMADKMLMHFADGSEHLVSTCYYEFAQRHTDLSGQIYEGFVPASANHIFDSTSVLKT
ncbi:protein of unknown function [Oceanospirillum multiglobuliferum]|uniref:2-oxoadipate dioxygenase/decarboxylase n=1 Tax=Oceanospirillum multiglobuliferum TaxID=64969 RepID=A0A1T4PRK0_9GAMM|nr:DUF1338 domain-containing protein [Oceanospirillum multiglobuliferum]OPX55347.1 succinyldiaminopimelate aminotransferase [Oceanospirillum multiglobuliferum]SJZ94264.1 protein of unknown function [Oceanospirillum multiglobuliferum]